MVLNHWPKIKDRKNSLKFWNMRVCMSYCPYHSRGSILSILHIYPQTILSIGISTNETHIKCINHIRYIGRFSFSQFDDSLGGVGVICTQWVHFWSTQPPKLYFPKIMEFSHHDEYGVHHVFPNFKLPRRWLLIQALAWRNLSHKH